MLRDRLKASSLSEEVVQHVKQHAGDNLFSAVLRIVAMKEAGVLSVDNDGP
jgi:hypothetical protein